MEPLYEGKIDRKRLYVPCRLDDILFALRLEGDCVATFVKEPVPLLFLRHSDVFEAEVEEALNDSDEYDVFGGIRWLCAETEDVKRDGRRFIFREQSLEYLSLGNKSPVFLDVVGENLVVVRKDDWPKYVAFRLINGK